MERTRLLTPREVEVMELIARWRRSSKEAGVELGISHKRVDQIASRVGEKLGTADRREAALATTWPAPSAVANASSSASRPATIRPWMTTSPPQSAIDTSKSGTYPEHRALEESDSHAFL